MKEITAKFDITYPICNPKRRSQALILCQAADGRFVLAGKKGYYPDDFCRLLGGGINEEEDPTLGAVRELKEEIGIDSTTEQVEPICVIHSETSTNEGDITLNIYLYFCKFAEGTDLNAGDDVSDLRYLTTEELQDLITRMGNMSGKYVGVTKGKTVTMDWKDWGMVYQQIHKTALDWYVENRQS